MDDLCYIPANWNRSASTVVEDENKHRESPDASPPAQMGGAEDAPTKIGDTNRSIRKNKHHEHKWDDEQNTLQSRSKQKKSPSASPPAQSGGAEETPANESPASRLPRVKNDHAENKTHIKEQTPKYSKDADKQEDTQQHYSSGKEQEVEKLTGSRGKPQKIARTPPVRKTTGDKERCARS